MPIVGAIFGGFDFSNYFIPLSSEVTATSLEAAREQGAVFAYGNFHHRDDQLPDPGLDHLHHGEGREQSAPPAARDEKVAEVPPAPPADILLLTEIRDLLARK